MIVVFIGEGWIPQMGYNPPSVEPNAGRLAFFNGINVRFDGLLNVEDDFVAKKTIFICQASYSGNVIQEAAKSKRCLYAYLYTSVFVLHLCNSQTCTTCTM